MVSSRIPSPFLLLGVFFLGALVCACGADGSTPPPQPALDIHNQSQFELEEIRVHPSTSYLETPNELSDNQPLREEEVFTIDPFPSPSYVTVFRRRTALGVLIAITTAERIEIETGTFTLIVFDDSFRLLPP